jgi:hypothetical protein
VPILSPDRNKSGNQPLQKGPFFIFLMIMPIFVALIVMILLVMQYKQLKSFVSAQPIALPAIETSPDAQQRVQNRLREFLAPHPAAAREAAGAPATATSARPEAASSAAPTSASDAALSNGALAAAPTGNAPDTLTLTAGDLNHLIRGSQELEKLRLDYHLEMQDSVLVARNSMPVERLIGPLSTMAKILRMKGYLNSEMKGYPTLENGKVIMIPVSAVMNGIPAPASVLNSKGKLDLRDWVGDKDAFDRAVAGLKEIRIRDGRLLLIRS